jgi:putative transposase
VAKRAVQEKGVSIKQACEALQVSKTYYRYQPKCRTDNNVIVHWLIRENRRDRGYAWNQKRVY